jgi:hypothetical protein
MLAGTLFIVRSKLRRLFRLGKGRAEEPEETAIVQGQEIPQ